MGPLSIKIGLPILVILYILVLQLFHLLFWSFTTNLDNLLGFLHVYHLVFLDFFFYLIFSFLDFFFIGRKVSKNKYPLFTILMKQNLIKILHSELVKKKCMSDLLGDPRILLGGLVIMGDLPLKNKKLIYFHKWLPF